MVHIRLAFLSAFFGVFLAGQSTLNQQISGQVLDATGATLPGVGITVTEQDTGLNRQAKTNASGRYEVADLPAGKYRLTCEAPGFKKEIISDNLLSTDAGLEVNFKLQVGNQGESIMIEATAAQVETGSGELSFGFTGDQINQLQLNGRNFTELLSLIPGVSTNYNSGFELYGGYGVNSGGQSVNGGRPDSASWNLDGADNKDDGSGSGNFINVSPDAIGEVRVLTSNFSAQYGSSSGAVVNVSLRGGTTKYHGSAYEYWRNDALAATAFNQAVTGKPNLRWNNFGASVGGPVIIPGTNFNRDRNKLFFFYSEDVKILNQGSTTTWTVPTALQKSGNFGTLTVKDPVTQIAYPKNTIPASLINPNMQKLIDLYPNPNSGTASFIFNEGNPTDTHEELTRIDYHLDSANQISFHFTHDYYQQLENTTQLVEYHRQVPGENTSIEWNHIFTPSLINVAQFTYSGNVITQQSNVVPNPTFLTSFTRAGLGLTEPTIYNASADIPQVAVSGFSTLAVTPLAFNNFNRIFNFKNDLTKVAGNHTLRAGMLFMRSRKNQDNPPAINGQYTFSTSRSPTSGQALADALLGDFYQYTESQSVRQGWFRFSQIEPYLQDDWRVTGRLTLNLGLRWSYMQPQYSALDNTVQFLPQYYNPAQASTINPSTGVVISAPNPYNGLVIPGPGFPATAQGRVPQATSPAVLALFHNLPQGGVYTQWNNFAPRLGFAFDPTGHQNTVIRGGYGISYERVPGNFLFNAINNTPFNPSAYVLNGSVNNPAAAAAGPVSVQTISNSHYLDMKVPRTMTYSLGGQRRLPANILMTLTYAGSTAANLSYVDDINQLPLGRGIKTTVNVNALRPYLGYGTIQEYTTGANFVYNSLQSQLRKSFNRGGIASLAYTWSKGRTDANAYNYQPENSYNLRGDWGNSSYNRNQVLAGSYAYPLPFWRQGGAWYKQAFGGWQTSGVLQIQSGLPVNPIIGTDQAGTGDGGQRPNLIGNPYSGGNAGGYQILNSQAFAVPTLGTFGNLGAYNIFLPRWINWNASIVKAFYVREHFRSDIRLELYNVANHLSVTAINTGGFNGPTTANWGAESGTTNPRNMQITLRVSY